MRKTKHLKKGQVAKPDQRSPTLKSILNTGYSETGGSLSKSTLAGWQPQPSSPESDINANLATLRGRSRSLVQGNSPIASAAINRSRINVVGAGLYLSAIPDARILNLTPEQAREWAWRTQREFDLWASSKECDLLRMNNFYDLQDIVYTGYLLNGDGWAAFRYGETSPRNPYSLKIHVFEADRVVNPNVSFMTYGNSPYTVWDKNEKTGNRIVNGVEINSNGAVVAFWISNGHPYDPTKLGQKEKIVRVQAFEKAFGFPNVLQIKHDERAEQYRGVPYLAPVIEAMKQVGRFTHAELNAAIIKAFLTLFITKSSDAVDGGFGMEQTDALEERIDLSKFQLGTGSINQLPNGYNLETVDGSKSMAAFDPFMSHIISEIGAGLNIPYEVLLGSFKSSYSASRAALLQAWQEFRTRRTWFTRDFCQPVYERFLVEAVANGRIQAPGFFADPLYMAAWSKAMWYGPVPGQIDREKEVRAAALAVNYGFSTHEKEARELGGGEYWENIDAVSAEQKGMAERGMVSKELPATLVVREGGKED